MNITIEQALNSVSYEKQRKSKIKQIKVNKVKNNFRTERNFKFGGIAY